MWAVTLVMGLASLPASLAMLPVCFLGGMAFAGLGMCFTGFVKNIEMFNFPVFLFVTPMFLFSGIFFPLSSLPSWAQKVAWALPLTSLVSSLRALAFGRFPVELGRDILILALLAFGSSFLGVFLMKKRLLK
jgi:lipooligosaccharide transport system permease protein